MSHHHHHHHHHNNNHSQWLQKCRTHLIEMETKNITRASWTNSKYRDIKNKCNARIIKQQ